jgi:inorganic pyrophosphatase/exopolyphosphatase
MKVITSGSAYIDIDAYACIVAYAELLQEQGIEAIAVSTSVLNESITATVQGWPTPLKTTYTPAPDDTFTLVDVSESDYFDTIVDVSKVDEIIDHHPGFEGYWQEHIGDRAHIEFIGAACTLVYERWKAAGLLERMSVTSARLLICGILDNTLNFGAKVTALRDRAAYDTLLPLADLPDNWTDLYFTECQEAILADAATAIRNDTKILQFKSYDRPICFGQLVVWDGEQVIARYEDALRETLKTIKSDWLMNVISVKDQKSYFVADNPKVQKWLTELLNIRFDDMTAIANRSWLRKEVIKEDSIFET